MYQSNKKKKKKEEEEGILLYDQEMMESRSRVLPGTEWNYPGLSEPYANPLPTVHESLVYVHRQTKRCNQDSSEPDRILSNRGTSHQGSNILAASFDVKKTRAMGLYSCPVCDKGFTKKYRFMDHVNAHNKIKAHTCPKCSKRFTFASDVKRHLRNGVCTKYMSSL